MRKNGFTLYPRAPSLPPGFTLMEVLLVVSIMVVLLSGSWVALSQLQGQGRVRSASDEIRSMLRWAREMSVAEKGGTRYKVREASGAIIVENLANEEQNRYQLPSGTTVAPTGFSYEFLAVTGEVAGCPCQIQITARDVTGTVDIGELGIIK